MRLSSDLHMCAPVHVHTHTYTRLMYRLSKRENRIHFPEWKTKADQEYVMEVGENHKCFQSNGMYMKDSEMALQKLSRGKKRQAPDMWVEEGMQVGDAKSQIVHQ